MSLTRNDADYAMRSRTLPKTRRFSGTWSTVSTLLRKGKMCEGRRSQVVLLDERRLELLIQPKLYAGELLDLVASHFHLKEKEYFGIAYPNDTGQYSWLQLDKRVLEHEFPKKCSSTAPALTLYFRVKYFVESITQLRDSATVEAFYLQAKSLVSKGELEADSETIFQLAALVLQATYGDYVDESMFRSHLRRLPILPTLTLKEYPSITNCEDKVLKHYTGLAGQSRGDAIVNYLTIVESLPTYGQHYYEVKDKSGNHCWLGLSYRGISQYEKNDRRNATRVFLWKQLENLYFRDKKFTIEVHEARRVIHTLSSFNLYEDAIEEPVEEYDDLSDAICDPTTQVSVSRRTLAPANVTVYVWYALSPVVTKCIWSMAIAQHHFFLDRRHQKSQIRLVPCLSQIATELCRSVQSLSSAGSQSNISRSTSSSSLPSTILGGEISEESKAATLEMLTALQARKEALEETLKKKNEELKSLCLKEGELTGEIPPEIPLQPGEARPQVRRRVGTSFSLSDKLICRTRSKERETLSDLELEYEIQSKIASAAYQLANDCTARKSVRKQRKLSYVQATAKLRSLELKLHALQRERKRKAAEKCDKVANDGSESSVSSTEKGALDSSQVNLAIDSLSSQNASETGTLKSSVNSNSSVPPCSSLPQLTVTSSDSRPESPDKCRQRHQSLQHMPFSGSAEGGNENNVPCGWSVASSYCPGLEFDTISCSSSVSAMPLRSPYRNRFESRLDIEGSNLYSVPNRRASQVFDSQDDLLLSGRKSDFDKRSPSTCIPVGHNQYSNTIPLSASYDERLWCPKPKDLAAVSSDCSLLETSFDGHSSNSCDNYFQATSHKQVLVELPQNVPKLHHFYSENSLHHEEFNVEGAYPGEQDIVKPVRKITHVQSVPHLHEEVTANHEQFPRNTLSSSSNSHSLNQVADLVNASMLRQGGKKSTTNSPRGFLSPKTKTKEWLETSLDSPIPMRKNKSRSACDNSSAVKNAVSENTYPYENHDIRLSPYPQDQQYDSSTEPTISHARCSSQYHDVVPDDQWTCIESPSRYSPVELRKKPAYDFRETSSNFVSASLPSVNDNQKSMYDNFCHNRTQDAMNGHAVPQVATSQNSFLRSSRIDSSGVSEIHENSHYSDFRCQSSTDIHHLTADQHLTRVQIPSNEHEVCSQNISPEQEVQDQALSRCQILPPVCPSQHAALNHSVNDVNLNDIHYNEATVVDIPQEIVESLTPCNGNSFPYPGSVEVNVVSVGHFQPYWEETKPYEISDFYKYSTKHRKPQQNSAVERTDPPKHVVNRQWNEPGDYTLVDASVFQNACDTVGQNPLSCSQNEMLMNAHVASVVDHVDYKKLEYNSLYGNDHKNIVTSPQSSDGNSSFGEIGMRVSVADTFHEEMLAWYENRETVKKATLV